jgi:hypothetical protein
MARRSGSTWRGRSRSRERSRSPGWRLTHLPPTDRFAVLFPHRGKRGAGAARVLHPLRGRTDGEAVRWGQVSVIPRQSGCELNGKGAKRPGLARNSFVVSTVSTKTGASRGAVIRKPSDRGFLTRSDGGPRRAGHWHVPDRRGDFSPCLPRPPIPSPPGLCPDVSGNLPRPDTKASLKTTGERFPLVHPRKPQRSPYVRPSRAFRCKHYAAGPKREDNLGRKSLGH